MKFPITFLLIFLDVFLQLTNAIPYAYIKIVRQNSTISSRLCAAVFVDNDILVAVPCDFDLSDDVESVDIFFLSWDKKNISTPDLTVYRDRLVQSNDGLLLWMILPVAKESEVENDMDISVTNLDPIEVVEHDIFFYGWPLKGCKTPKTHVVVAEQESYSCTDDDDDYLCLDIGEKLDSECIGMPLVSFLHVPHQLLGIIFGIADYEIMVKRISNKMIEEIRSKNRIRETSNPVSNTAY